MDFLASVCVQTRSLYLFLLSFLSSLVYLFSSPFIFLLFLCVYCYWWLDFDRQMQNCFCLQHGQVKKWIRSHRRNTHIWSLSTLLVRPICNPCVLTISWIIDLILWLFQCLAWRGRYDAEILFFFFYFSSRCDPHVSLLTRGYFNILLFIIIIITGDNNKVWEVNLCSTCDWVNILLYMKYKFMKHNIVYIILLFIFTI